PYSLNLIFTFVKGLTNSHERSFSLVINKQLNLLKNSFNAVFSVCLKLFLYPVFNERMMTDVINGA
ncbi:hypothetical protein, partial [Enterococcus avium]|uniref:hypothetical protein n=1 Tax=Enterococcus avium TaxID=33945 RepID=UPI002E1489C9